tara:strand:+ start:581 stop:1099 length:519 start_codon:yes stop_codon:yes gene_type:complete
MAEKDKKQKFIDALYTPPSGSKLVSDAMYAIPITGGLKILDTLIGGYKAYKAYTAGSKAIVSGLLKTDKKVFDANLKKIGTEAKKSTDDFLKIKTPTDANKMNYVQSKKVINTARTDLEKKFKIMNKARLEGLLENNSMVRNTLLKKTGALVTGDLLGAYGATELIKRNEKR